MENMGHAGSSYIASLLNSSPRLDFGVLSGLPALDGAVAASGCLEKLCGDPGFAERAARLSSFGGQRYPGAGGLFGPPAPAPAASNGEFGGSRAESSVSDPASTLKDATANGNCKKRKAAGGKGKGKEPSLSSSSCKGAEAKESDAKRCKLEENTVQPKVEQTGSDSSTEDRGRKPGKEKNSKPVEPPKDYVHVRARRGQATDSHSLAERVRREKISQRMKVLQDLVPGCNKVTGKALMLDEIINYVQSLQQQVEFLSMKLATVNPQLNFGNLPALLQKDMYQACGPSASSVFPLEGAGEGFAYGDQVDLFQSFALNGMESQCSLSPLDSALSHATNTQYAFQNETTNATLQQTNFWEGSLQTVPHVDNGQTQENGALAQSFHGW